MIRYHLVQVKKQYKLGIAFDYDHNIVQIMRDLKGVFGGKFNWDFKIWIFPFKVISTFENRLDNTEKIEIDDDVLEYVEKERNKAKTAITMSRNAKSNISVPCPEGKKYRPFQLAGIEFMVNYPGVLQGDQMGCLSGDTIISVMRRKKVFKIKLKDMYLRFNGKTRKNWNWDRRFNTTIKSINENGILLHNKVNGVVYSGKKKTIKISLKSGKSIILTPDHLLMNPNREWIESKNLSVGDKLLTNGKPVCEKCGNDNIIKTDDAKFSGFCLNCIYRYKRKKPNYKTGKFLDKDGYVLVSGQFEHPFRDNSNTVREHRLVMEKHLGRYLNPKEVVHHKNGKRSDNRIENLELTNIKEHAHLHPEKTLHFDSAITANKGIIYFIPVEDEVIKIEDSGVIDVYDVQMNAPNHNFVANGIIVHNCGKTIQSIGTINYLTEIKKVLIIAPKTLTYTWKAELENWLTRDLSIGIGNHKEFPDTDIRITHYEVLRRMVDLQFHWKKQVGTNKLRRGRAKKITDWGNLGCEYDLIICDEAHKIKNPKAQQSIIVYQLAKFIKRRWYLTGSPFGSYIIDLWPLINSLNPNYWNNWHQFTTRYCWDGFENKGAKNIPELKIRLRESVMIRRTKEQVLKELPAKIYQLIEIPDDGFKTLLKQEQQFMEKNDFFDNNRREYDIIRNRMEKLTAGDSEGWEALSNKVDRLCDTFRGFVGPIATIRKEIAIKKAPIVIEIIKDVIDDNPKKKVGIYCHHKDVIDKFTRHYFGKCVKIDGRITKSEDRRKAVELFQNNPAITRFIGSIRAAGEGITLTASSHVVMAEIDFVPSQNEQAIDRFHRIGQKDSVLVQIPVVKGSIEALIAKRNVEKQKIADMLLN
jgi:SWI/SNF-related matrix-associated actin-dependent regulator 1 of chromatin subfamily A